MKNAIIAVLSAIIYRNICVGNDTFAIAFGTVCMAGCVYFMMREVDKWSAKKGRRWKG